MGNDIGGKIRSIRKRKGMTQSNLATKAGIAQSTLSYVENGSKHPHFDTLSSICSALGVTVFELLAYGEQESVKKMFEEQLRAASLLSSDGVLLSDQKDFQESLYQKYVNIKAQ